MAVELTATGTTDIDRLLALFTKAFHLKGGEPLLNPSLLQWKYFDPRPDWPGSRSYVLHSGDRWMAHACVCPMPFQVGDKPVRGVLLVDWLSAVPGAGAHIYRRFYPLIDVLFGNGGSTQARRTIQELKYPVIGAVEMYARVFKPFDLYSRGRRGAADLLRLGRNVFQVAMPSYRPAGEWRSEHLTQFTAAHASLCGHTPHAYLQTIRSPELLNYYLRCPLARISGYAIWQGREARGYFLLGEFASETKLVDLRLHSAHPEAWAAAVALVAEEAAKLAPPMLFASSTFPLLSEALRKNAFRHFGADPLYLHDPEGRLTSSNLPLHITPFDGDQAYQ